jgi:hypothetical protein
MGTVNLIFDIGGIYSKLHDHVGLAVHIEHGTLGIGNRLTLSGPESSQEMEIVGVELGGPIDRKDPLLLRIHCKCRPVRSWPYGPVSGWKFYGADP